MTYIKTNETGSKINTIHARFSEMTVIRGGLYGQPLTERNWCFIDMQNLYMGVKEEGWKIDWFKFREYLHIEHHVVKAIAFMGYVPKYEWLYELLEKAGFELECREVNELQDGSIDGGNIDADLSGYIMDHKVEYDRAIVVADDGDYCNTFRSLNKQRKLKLILSSHIIGRTSRLLKREIGENMIMSIHALRKFIKY